MWLIETECEKCGYYEVVDEDENEEIVFCMSPLAHFLDDNRPKICPSFIEKGIPIIPKPTSYEDRFLYYSDFEDYDI